MRSFHSLWWKHELFFTCMSSKYSLNLCLSVVLSMTLGNFFLHMHNSILSQRHEGTLCRSPVLSLLCSVLVHFPHEFEQPCLTSDLFLLYLTRMLSIVWVPLSHTSYGDLHSDIKLWKIQVSPYLCVLLLLEIIVFCHLLPKVWKLLFHIFLLLL